MASEWDIVEAMEGFPHLQEAAARRRADLVARGVPRRAPAEGRRRLREAEDVLFDLDDDELDEVLAETRRYAREGDGERGGRPSRREVIDFVDRLLDAAHAEPSEADEALVESLGIQPRGRRRLRAGEMSTQEFRRRLMEGGGSASPQINPYGGSWPQSY